MKSKTRKPSWQLLDLALKIQVAPRHDSAKLVLIFLAAKANNAGESYHGYLSIHAHFGFGKSTISRALRYLRDELRVLTWEHGSGGFNKKDTNQYRLNLDAMKELVTAQDIFDVETGRLKKYLVESHGDTESSPMVGLSVESHGRSVESHGRSVESHGDASRVPPWELNPQEPSDKSNPQYETIAPGSVFSAPSSSPSLAGMEVVRSMAPAPLCAAPPVESREATRTQYAGSAVTENFLDAHSPAKSRKVPKTPLELAQGIHKTLQREAPDAPILKALPKNWESDWKVSIGYAISKEWVSLDELRTLARFAVDHKLPEILNYGAPGLVGSLDSIRQHMKEAEVRS